MIAIAPLIFAPSGERRVRRVGDVHGAHGRQRQPAARQPAPVHPQPTAVAVEEVKPTLRDLWRPEPLGDGGQIRPGRGEEVPPVDALAPEAGQKKLNP